MTSEVLQQLAEAEPDPFRRIALSDAAERAREDERELRSLRLLQLKAWQAGWRLKDGAWTAPGGT